MKTLYSSKEEINGHVWQVVSHESSRDGRFYWTLIKDGREHPLERDSVKQKTPKLAIIMAHYFNLGINSIQGVNNEIIRTTP